MNRLFRKFRWWSLILTILVSAAAGSTCFAAQETAGEALDKAREDLRLSLATQKRIAEDIEALKRSGNASPEVLREYAVYLKNVALMVEENRRILDSMEAAYTGRTGAGAGTDSGGSDAVPEIAIPEENRVDRLTALDRELNSSLAAFDEMLLKELELIRAESAEKMKDLAVEAADAAKRLAEKGEHRGESEEAGDRDSQDTAGRQKDSAAETDGYKQERTAPGRKGGTGRSAAQRSSGSAEDDDIVARQLREAAENETDPELREKLWKKYEEYKNSTRN
jgi:hypothetical protein